MTTASISECFIGRIRAASRSSPARSTTTAASSGGAGLPGINDAYVGATAVSLRAWFDHDLVALTARAEYFTNPSRYLAQFPPASLATEPGNDLKIWGVTGGVELMPTDFFSVRAEVNWRHASVPYFSGPDGTTSPSGFLPTPVGYVGTARRDQTLLILAANVRL